MPVAYLSKVNLSRGTNDKADINTGLLMSHYMNRMILVR
jgi:hypothetical protein